MDMIFLPLAKTVVWWPGLVLLGLFIGIISGMFGVGGGFLLTPVLRIVFDIPYPVAIGSGLLQIFLTSILSAWKYWQIRCIDLKMGMVMAAGGFLGAEIGVRSMKAINAGKTFVINGKAMPVMDMVISLCFLLLLLFVTVMTLHESSSGKGMEPQTRLSKWLQQISLPPVMSFRYSAIAGMSVWIPLGISFMVGTLTGLLGIGGGFIAFPLMIYAIGIPTSIAAGTSSFQILFTSGYGALRHYSEGNIDFILVVTLLIGSLVGVNIGVRIARLLAGHHVRKYFALLLILAILLIIYDLFCKFGFGYF